MSEESKPVRVWIIGPDTTEIYAARSEEEMRDFYTGMVGKEQAEEDFAAYFEEITGSALDVEFDFDTEGKIERTTWRKVAESCAVLPTQISTSYN